MYLSHWVGIDDADRIDDEGKHFTVAANRREAERTLEKLADLIDRPTCRNVSGDQDVFECSECGCKAEMIIDVCNEYGDTFSMSIMPSFCPECGSEVMDDAN